MIELLKDNKDIERTVCLSEAALSLQIAHTTSYCLPDECGLLLHTVIIKLESTPRKEMLVLESFGPPAFRPTSHSKSGYWWTASTACGVRLDHCVAHFNGRSKSLFLA